jgi:hypothetical protein
MAPGSGRSVGPTSTTRIDPDLRGYYGVHVGDAAEWLPILVRDGYCDGTARVYHLDFPEHNDNEKNPDRAFYMMRDPHPMAPGEVPSSYIVFSRYETIPASIVTLKYEVPEDQLMELVYPDWGEEEDEDDEEGYGWDDDEIMINEWIDLSAFKK